jgi:hypothetical protein
MPNFCNSSHVNVVHHLLSHSGVTSHQSTYWPNFCIFLSCANVVVFFTLVVVTLALGSQPKQGLTKVRAKNEAQESHFMPSEMWEGVKE